MQDYTRTEHLKRLCADQAVAKVMGEFDFGENNQIVYNVALSVARDACDGLALMLQSEIRLIELYHSSKMQIRALSPMPPIFFSALDQAQKDET